VIKFVRLGAGGWFSPGTPVSSTIKTDSHNIAEMLLKMALKHHNPKFIFLVFGCYQNNEI
jgi:hypothetical protein